MTLGGKSTSDTRTLEIRKENRKPNQTKGQMAPPPPFADRKRAAPATTESMDTDEEFFSPGTQVAAISLLDLRPRKRNREDNPFKK